MRSIVEGNKMEKIGKILVIDDDQAIQNTFKRIFRGDEYETYEVPHGKQALELTKGQKFDICFLDIRMPGMDGVDTFKALKELQPDMPIVMMTGFALEDKIKETLNLGAVDYLYKPFDIIEINSILSKLEREKELS